MSHALLTTALLLAQETEVSERGYAISWALILLSVVLGLIVALRATKREDKVKKPKA